MVPTPAVNQIWKDNDPRSKGTGEFTIVEIVKRHDVEFAKVRRESGRMSRIRVDRLTDFTKNKNGYSYVGKGR